jgi:hypothetical protein
VPGAAGKGPCAETRQGLRTLQAAEAFGGRRPGRLRTASPRSEATRVRCWTGSRHGMPDGPARNRLAALSGRDGAEPMGRHGATGTAMSLWVGTERPGRR